MLFESKQCYNFSVFHSAELNGTAQDSNSWWRLWAANHGGAWACVCLRVVARVRVCMCYVCITQPFRYSREWKCDAVKIYLNLIYLSPLISRLQSLVRGALFVKLRNMLFETAPEVFLQNSPAFQYLWRIFGIITSFSNASL